MVRRYRRSHIDELEALITTLMQVSLQAGEGRGPLRRKLLNQPSVHQGLENSFTFLPFLGTKTFSLHIQTAFSVSVFPTDDHPGFESKTLLLDNIAHDYTIQICLSFGFPFPTCSVLVVRIFGVSVDGGGEAVVQDY